MVGPFKGTRVRCRWAGVVFSFCLVPWAVTGCGPRWCSQQPWPWEHGWCQPKARRSSCPATRRGSTATPRRSTTRPGRRPGLWTPRGQLVGVPVPLLASCPRCDAPPRVRWGNSVPKCPTACNVVSRGTGSTIVLPPWVREGELHVPLRARSCDPSLWSHLQAAPLWDMGSSLACPSTPPCFLSPRESQRTFDGGGWGTRDQPRGAA